MPTFYVSSTGNDTTGDGSQLLPYATTTKAYSVASDGDTIQCADGTILDASTVTLNKALTIDGASQLGTVLQSSNASRIFLLSNSKTRVFSDLTLQNDSAVAGPSSLVESSGAGIDLLTTFLRVFFSNGRVNGSINLASGHYGITVDTCTFLVDISTLSQSINLVSPGGNITVRDSIFTVTVNANGSMNGVLRQSGAATAGVVTLTGNTFNIAKGVYVIRFGTGNWATGSTISNNTINITSTSYTRPVMELGDFNGVATLSGNTINIDAETLSSVPIQIRSTVGTGPNCVWTIENNVINTHNVDGYAIIAGDEGGDVNSKKDAFNGSIIRNNTIKSGNFFGLAIGAIHSIMTGGNINMFIEGNSIYNGGYGVVMKGNGTWTDGYVKNNKIFNCTYGIYPKGQKNIRVINNLIIGDNGNHSKGVLPGDLGAGASYATGTVIKNNIFKISSGYAVYVEANCQTGLELDYNVYYLTGTAKAANINGVEYATVAALQAAGYELHGVSGDPALLSDYSVNASSPAFEKGINVKGIHSIPDRTTNNLITLSGAATFSTDRPYAKRVLVS